MPGQSRSNSIRREEAPGTSRGLFYPSSGAILRAAQSSVDQSPPLANVKLITLHVTATIEISPDVLLPAGTYAAEKTQTDTMGSTYRIKLTPEQHASLGTKAGKDSIPQDFDVTKFVQPGAVTVSAS